MDSNKIIEELYRLYPENLNEVYKCNWWYTSDIDGNSITYYLSLENKFEKINASPMICIRAHCSDPESLVMSLKMYLDTVRY